MDVRRLCGSVTMRVRALAEPDGALSKPGRQKCPPEQRAPGGEHTDGQDVAEQQMWHEGDRETTGRRQPRRTPRQQLP